MNSLYCKHYICTELLNCVRGFWDSYYYHNHLHCHSFPYKGQNEGIKVLEILINISANSQEVLHLNPGNVIQELLPQSLHHVLITESRHKHPKHMNCPFLDLVPEQHIQAKIGVSNQSIVLDLKITSCCSIPPFIYSFKYLLIHSIRLVKLSAGDFTSNCAPCFSAEQSYLSYIMM